ncbi:MAG: family 10 glycosylhydrolase [Thermoguttaceae bacterium]
MVLLVGLWAAVCQAETLRVRVAWGGGAERLWDGSISLSQGALSEPQLLGIEADEPGSMWLEDGRLIIRQRAVRAYDGVDLVLSAPPDAKLQVQLTAADDKQRGPQIEIPLGDVSSELRTFQLDHRDNRLLVRRAPGDSLRVRTTDASMVFAPGERLKLNVTPHLLPVPADAKIRIKAQLIDCQQHELWSKQWDARAGQAEAIPLEVELPGAEGVYDLAVTATQTASWTHPVRPTLYWKRSLAERRVQVLVLERHPPPDQARVRCPPGRELTQVLEIDPATPHWWEKVKWGRLARPAKGPLGNGTRQTVRHALGELSQLAAPSARGPDVSWEAYGLTLAAPGRPYVLEVDYPSDVPQTLGISVLEPNAAGALAPIALGSGVDVPAELVGGVTRWARHRLVFWPRTATPLVLLSNRRDGMPAVYGKLRVLGGWEHLPRLPLGPPGGPQRVLAAYLDRPLLPENFAANEILDPWSGRSLNDWTTFHEAGTRLVEYLQYAGYNALMMCVVADGSALYPSELLQPTPRYDTGVFFASAQDPLRKDVLEMLLRLLDREDLQLIPAVELASPLPALEALARRSAEERQGLEWIGPDGTSWTQTYGTRRGLAPYYNLLDPRVQDAVLDVVRELVARYARHPAFAGLALRLSAYGYAQLPGPEWGLDDATIARFVRETGLAVPGEGPGRFAARSAFLLSDAHRDRWLGWRAAQCYRFYRRVRDVLAAVRPDVPLYLAGAEMFAGPELSAALRPALPPRATLADALLAAGIDPRHYQEDHGIVLLRPERIVPGSKLAAQAAELELRQMAEADYYFHGLPRPGSLFFHPPQEAHIPSFDQKSPFKSSFAWLVTETVPSGAQNRRRFVHALAAMDSQILVDGGWLLPLGQEESLQGMAATYRRLPPVRFAAADAEGRPPGSQPVTLRWASTGGRTYLYVVNDAPFGTLVRVPLDASPECALRELSGLRRVAPLTRDADGAAWVVDLEPYDLAAIELSQPDVKVGPPQVTVPAAVPAVLEQRIRELGVRAAALRSPPLLRVLENPGFETAPTTAEPVPGWAISRRLGANIRTDPAQAHGGSRSARISSDGPIACLVSRPFEPPSTGRLSILVWLRTAGAARQPPLRLAIEGKLCGRDYYRFTAVGQPAAAGQPPVPIAAAWGCYIFQVDDLPLEGLSQLRVRFDLMGQGDVWVDDVQLFDLALSETELRALYKLITMASVTLQNGHVGDCMRLLEGYWPRFLLEHVPLAPGEAIAARPAETRPAAPSPPAPPPATGWLDRMRNLFPERLW